MGRELDNKFFFTVVLPFHSCMRTTVHLIRNRKTFTICYPGPVLQSLFPSPMMLQYLFPLPSVAIPISLTSVTIPIISALLHPYFPHLCCNPNYLNAVTIPIFSTLLQSLFSSPL